MNDFNGQSTLNEFWEAITEIVQGNTPSPAEPELESNYSEKIEPQKFTCDIYRNPAVENYSSYSGSQFPYIGNGQKSQSQSLIDLIRNEDLQGKLHNSENQNFIDSFLGSDKHEKGEITGLSCNDLAPMNSPLSAPGQISFIKDNIQNKLRKKNIPFNEPTVLYSPSSQYQEEDDDEEKGEEKYTLNMDLDRTMTENKSLINDNDLVKLSVRDLNKMLKLYPKKERQKLKQRRRLLKNRGYAQTCRTRRINTQKTLLEENERLKELLHKTNIEKNMYKTKYENLKSLIKKVKLDRERKKEYSII